MIKILFIVLLLPALCHAEPWYYNSLPWKGLGCDSFFETSCYDNYDEEVRYHWQYLSMTEEEIQTVYLLEKRLYDKGYLLTEPLHWMDYKDAELWDKKYLSIIDAVDIPDVK